MSNDSPTVLGQATSLTASVTGGTEITYDWDLGDGLLLSDAGASLTHTYAKTGIFTVTVTARNSLGNDSATTVVTVEETLPDPITGLSVSNDSPVILGQATSLTASVTGGTEITYDWDLGDGLLMTDAGTSLIHTYTTTGLFTVTVTAHNSVSNESATTVVRVDEIPPDPITGLSVSNDSPAMLGESTLLSASIAGGEEVNYVWDFGDGSPPYSPPTSTETESMVSHKYGAVGTYIAQVTASNSVSSETATTTVVIEDVPPDANFSSSSPDHLGQTTGFINTSSGSNLSFEWDFGDGSGSTLTKPAHTYDSTGEFIVTLTATNSAGSDTVSKKVKIKEPLDNSGQNLTPLELSGLAPLWVENFTNGSIDKMQYTWAKGDHAALRSFVIPGAMYFGQEGAPGWPWVEQEINNFKEYNGEPLPNTLEFDLLNPSEGHARISLRPRRLSDFAHIYVGVDNNKTRISYRFLPNKPITTIYYDEPTGSSLGWAHVTVSYSQYESAGATYGHYVIAINEEVHEISATSSITSPNWLTYWNSTPEADGWSIEYNGFETTTTGRYLANLRAYSGFISKPEMEERLEGRLDDYLADIPDPREYDGPTKAFEVHKLLEMHGPNALAYTQQLDGLSIRFDGSLSSGWKKITAYDWTFGDGESDSGRLVEHTYAQPGTYEATLTVENKYGTDTHAFTVVIE